MMPSEQNPLSYVARQPIIDLDGNLLAYELLYRESDHNAFPVNVDSTLSTVRVLTNQLFTKNCVTGEHIGFINFDERSILELIPLLINKDRLCVEILETCRPTPALLKAIRRLHKEGYSIALDDFAGNWKQWLPFFPYIKYIKVDISQIDVYEIRKMMKIVSEQYGIEFIAERIESVDDYNHCKVCGFTYFQGYYFSEPQVIKRKSLSIENKVALRLQAEVVKPNVSFKAISKIIKMDVGMSCRLLQYINSYYNIPQKIDSIEQAVSYLGTDQLRRFINVVVMSTNQTATSPHITKLGIYRSNLLHELALTHRHLRLNPDNAFLIGLLSVIKLYYGEEWHDIIAEMGVCQTIYDALNEKNTMGFVLLTLAYQIENGDWEQVGWLTKNLRIQDNVFFESHTKSMQVADRMSKVLEIGKYQEAAYQAETTKAESSNDSISIGIPRFAAAQ